MQDVEVVDVAEASGAPSDGPGPWPVGPRPARTRRPAGGRWSLPPPGEPAPDAGSAAAARPPAAAAPTRVTTPRGRAVASGPVPSTTVLTGALVPGPGPFAARPHRRRWTAAAVAVLVVLVAVEVAGRAASVQAAPETVPAGMLSVVEGPPWVRWRAPAARTDDVLAASGAVVVASVRDRRFGVVAHDVGTGATLWEQDLGEVAGTRPLTACPHDDGDVGDVLLCVVEPPVPARLPGEAAVVAPVPAPERRWARVSALDAATGAVLGTWTTTGRLVDAERIDDDLVLLRVDPDGHARVSRHDGVTGALRWSHRAADPMRLRTGIVSGAELRVTPSFVLVQGWTATVLDAADGRELAESPPASFAVGALGERVFATWTGGAGVSVRDRQGHEVFEDRALLPALAATDGTPDDVLVLDRGGSVAARSLVDGSLLWRLDSYRAPRVQAAGRVLLLGVDGFQVVDARTGDVAWETPYRALMWWSPVTDGHVVLAPGRAAGGAHTVEARGLEDGALLWSLPLEDGTRAVDAVGGHLLVRTRDEVVLLR